MSESSPSLDRLRADLHRAAEIADATQRALEVVAVIEEAAAPLGIRPTVVGGMAVYFWTEGDEFATYDIDVVMTVPERLAEILAQLGFVRGRDRRHWELPGTEVLLEAPGADPRDPLAQRAAGQRRAARGRSRGAACRVLSKAAMKPQRINYEEWRRDAPRRRAQTQRILAMLGPIRRDRPRHPTEAAFLRRIGTPEHLIGPDA